MKKALAGILAGVAVGAAVDAQAAPIVDKENGTITRWVQTGVHSDGKPFLGVQEVVSCRRGWVAVQRSTNEGGPSVIDLTVGNGNGGNLALNTHLNLSAVKRAEAVRAECKAVGLEPGF